jgi:hypothetical protein
VIQPGDVSDGSLVQKANLGGLLLEWSCHLDDPQDRTIDPEVLNELQPHQDLKELTIRCYGGTGTWLRNPFGSLETLHFENMEKCDSWIPLENSHTYMSFLFKVVSSCRESYRTAFLY